MTDYVSFSRFFFVATPIAEIVTNLKTFSNIIYRVVYACWMRNSRRQLAVYLVWGICSKSNAKIDNKHFV